MAIEVEGPNADQIEFWNGWMADRWVANQVAMDQLLVPLSEALISAAAVAPGERVLDVGCGCGDTTLALADLGGTVTGVDISEPMLTHARQRVLGRDNPTFLLDDAAARGFEGEFDVLFSRFGVMFFADPVAAFTNLRSALRPDGRVCFLCWQRPDLNSWVAVPMAAVQPLLPESEPVDPRAPGPFAFADPGYVTGILEDAGFLDVRLEALERPMRLGAGPAEAAEFVARIGPVSRAVAELDEEARQNVMATLEQALASHADDAGVALGAACWIVSAQRGD